MFQLLLIGIFAFISVNCSSTSKVERDVAFIPVGPRVSHPAMPNMEEGDDPSGQIDGPTIAEIEASIGVTSAETRDYELGSFAESLCVQNPKSCLSYVGGRSKEIRATLTRKKGKFYLDIEKDGQLSYSCLASPGTNGFLGLDKEAGRTPLFLNVSPYGLKELHVVSKAKSYAGARMAWTVWIQGGYAIHAGKPTGYRKSHGCINLTNECAKRFYHDVQAAGLRNTYITVKDN